MITAAAIRDHDGTIYTLPPPARHHTIIAHMVNVVGRPTPITGDQGFVNEAGIFHNRIQGAAEALRRKQIEKLKWPPNLYSEDLW